MKFKTIRQEDGPDHIHSNQVIADFLHQHLEEYGDSTEDILRCLDYVFDPARGGKVFLGLNDDEEIIGAVIINNTGMGGYIPEHILVYIALHKDHRGQGLGKKLMFHAQDSTEGDIALHVEKDNPARHLYERVGFTSPYLEMRWKRPTGSS